MSSAIVLALIFVLIVLAVVVFVAVVIGIHSEPHHQMTTTAQSPLAAIVRRLLGVYVGKPTDTDPYDHREECLTGQSTDWWNKGGGDR
jgi:hypothetical protein